jgi:hypothetical protein
MLTGYREVEDFGASATNVSLGRYFKSSTDNFNFVAMDYNTPDSNNAYPRVGPVVINEIMYNPPTGNQKEEYIELYNTTGVPQTLFRFESKNTPWRFTDGIDYVFLASPPVTIPANRYLLLVKDKPSFTDIRIDRVRYSDGSHPEDVPGGVDYWPFMADGYGFSLSRMVPGAYGNDVANWQGAIPTPGADNP